MKKIIRLTESDLRKIVKRVLNEQINVPIPSGSVSRMSDGNIVIGMREVDATPALSALLVMAGTLGVTKIFQSVREDKINDLLNTINEKLESSLNTAELTCLSKELSKLGRVVKLTDKKRLERVKKSIIHCLGDQERVDDIVVNLDSILKQFKKETRVRRQKGGHV